MVDPGLVERLRRLRGIEREFTDFRDRTSRAPDSTILALLTAMVGDGNREDMLARDDVRGIARAIAAARR